MRSNRLLVALGTVASVACFQGCVRDFNNPADPKNNGGFYGGIDPKIAGTWDDVNYGNPPRVYRNALVCSNDSFIFEGQNFTQLDGVMDARNGQIFYYYSNGTEPWCLYNYGFSATGDTLSLNENLTGSDQYVDPSTFPTVPKLIRTTGQ